MGERRRRIQQVVEIVRPAWCGHLGADVGRVRVIVVEAVVGLHGVALGGGVAECVLHDRQRDNKRSRERQSLSTCQRQFRHG